MQIDNTRHPIYTYRRDLKSMSSKGYNYIFNVKTGFFARWGTTVNEDPQFSELGPEIADIEISTVCSKGCPWCYKSNVKDGKNMSFETFDSIIKKFPQILCQIAFGIGDVDANPDLFKILRHCRRHLIVPNITINGSRLDEISASKLAAVCGSIAVSHYGDECFDAIKMLKDDGAKQVNIHQLLSKQTLDECWKVIKDPRIGNVHAIVFLSSKRKGRGSNLDPVTVEEMKSLVDEMIKMNIRFGFDSCSAGKFLKTVEKRKAYEAFKTSVEPCESGCFSIYINVDGKAYPCSFVEDVWEPVDVLGSTDFLKDVWNSPQISSFRQKLVEGGRNCPVYTI